MTEYNLKPKSKSVKKINELDWLMLLLKHNVRQLTV